MVIVNIILFISSLILVNGKVIDSGLFPLHLVHYNDFHARFEETTVEFPVCEADDASCLGGFARLFQEIKTLVHDYPDALVLNAGDTFQGTYWYSILKWDVTQKFINLIPNDVHALGNHEFDDGIEDLVHYIKALRAPVVAANLDTSDEPTMSGLYKPHVIVEKGGRNIGVIGLITTETATSSKSQKAKFLDPIPVVQKEAQLLKDQGVDIIVVLSHCGLEIDKQIANTVGENIDIIVGGHSHSLLWNGDSPSNETVSGSYPVLVEASNKAGHNVLVVTAASYSKYLGNITVYFDQFGEMKSFDGTPIFLNRSIPEDPEILSLLKPYKEKLHKLVREDVGFAEDVFQAEHCAAGECAIGNLVADAIRTEASLKNPTNLSAITLLLRNNIRSSIPSGNLTRGSIINVLPFSNQMISYDIEGKYILEALERCLTKVFTEDPFSGPWMSQVSGLKLTVNTTVPRHVVSVLVEEDNFQPLELDRLYQITTSDFLFNGGTGFTMLSKNAQNPKKVGIESDILEKYITQKSPLKEDNFIDGRLIVVQ